MIAAEPANGRRAWRWLAGGCGVSRSGCATLVLLTSWEQATVARCSFPAWARTPLRRPRRVLR